jgi:hypothetical protein
LQDFVRAFGEAGRVLGKAALSLEESERAALRQAGVTWPIDRWGVDELGRALLLLDAPAEAVTRAFFRGDNRERQAVLRALPLRADAEAFRDLAIEACRTNVVDVFEAIACESPYPGRFFPEPNFNQMVLKAIFVGVKVERILGLEERVGEDLVRMTQDFAAERRAAGRPVPEDVDFIARLGAAQSKRGAS